MPLSQALKDRAKRNKVRTTYTTAFGKRKQRSTSAVSNAVKKAVAKKKKSPTTRAQQMKRMQRLMYANKGALAAGAAGLASAGAAYYNRDVVQSRVVRPTRAMVGGIYVDAMTGLEGMLVEVKRFGMNTGKFMIRHSGGKTEPVELVNTPYGPTGQSKLPPTYLDAVPSSIELLPRDYQRRANPPLRFGRRR